MLATSASAQINPNDGPQVSPLQPEPTIGLPEQAPTSQPPSNAPQAVPAAPPARPAATPQPAQATPPQVENTAAWQLECIEQDAQQRMCQAILRARVNDQVAMVVAIAKGEDSNESRLQMALPLGIDMQRGAEVTIGDFSETMAPSRCTAQGCLVETVASDDLLAAMRAANAGIVRVYAPGGNAIDLPMPLAAADDVLNQAFAR
ncbi:MAG: invasion associated locus B family protein [Aliihoeflea sp.]|uniref:invasion associated locus B family protein n=1 Tax=Aliihoeflea sp. TaxID=2608088 RepID=UPI004037D9DD